MHPFGLWLRGVVVGVVLVVVLSGCGPVGGVEADEAVGELLAVGDEAGRWARAGELADEAAGVVMQESVSSQDVRGFYERFGAVFDSAVFAHALAERVAPSALVDFTTKVSDHHGAFETGDGHEVVDEVVAGVGAVAVLSAGGVVVGQDQMLSDETFGVDIEERVGQWRALGGSRAFAGVGEMLSAAGRRYPMVVAGPEFVSGLVPAVLEWDANRQEEAQAAGWWSAKKADDAVGGVLSVMDEPGPVVDEAGWARVDAVQEVLAADTPFDVDLNERLVRLPRVSFYEEGKAPVGPMTVARYLVGHRFVDGFKVSGDGGEVLGRVLAQAASVGRVPDGVVEGDPVFETWSDRQKRSTVIAGNALLGFQEGLEINASRVEGQSAFSAANAGLRSWMGEILAPHTNDLAKALRSHVPSAGWINPFSHAPLPDEDSDIDISSIMAGRLKGPEGLFVDLRFDQPEVDDGGTPEDPSDDVYPRGRIPASERLLVASLEGYHQQLLKEVITPRETAQEPVVYGWAWIFDALLTDSEPSLQDAVEVTVALNERVAQLRAGDVMYAPVVEGERRQMLDQIQGSPWAHEAIPTLQAIFPRKEDVADAAGLTGLQNRRDLLGKGFIVALATDPQFLQKYPSVREAMSADILGDNYIEKDESNTGAAVVLPVWLEDPSIPMPRLEEMTEREKIAFMASFTTDARLSNFFALTDKESLD